MVPRASSTGPGGAPKPTCPHSLGRSRRALPVRVIQQHPMDHPAVVAGRAPSRRPDRARRRPERTPAPRPTSDRVPCPPPCPPNRGSRPREPAEPSRQHSLGGSDARVSARTLAPGRSSARFTSSPAVMSGRSIGLGPCSAPFAHAGRNKQRRHHIKTSRNAVIPRRELTVTNDQPRSVGGTPGHTEFAHGSRLVHPELSSPPRQLSKSSNQPSGRSPNTPDPGPPPRPSHRCDPGQWPARPPASSTSPGHEHEMTLRHPRRL